VSIPRQPRPPAAPTSTALPWRYVRLTRLAWVPAVSVAAARFVDEIARLDGLELADEDKLADALEAARALGVISQLTSFVNGFEYKRKQENHRAAIRSAS